jgi:hypothetical protein
METAQGGAIVSKNFTSKSFTELLDSYLDMREQGPQETNGYTDKDYYRRLQEVSDQLDEMVSHGNQRNEEES